MSGSTIMSHDMEKEALQNYALNICVKRFMNIMQ